MATINRVCRWRHCALVIPAARQSLGGDRRLGTRLHRSGAKSYRQRKKNDEETTSLDWETFEFSTNPKRDGRFALNHENDFASDRSLEEIHATEAAHDERDSLQWNAMHKALSSLHPEVVQRALDVLQPYVNDRRLGRIEEALRQRTSRVKFLFENPSNPSNVWACLRTLDSFGVQYVDLVVDPQLYEGRLALLQKRGMRTAMGSANWLTIQTHSSTAQAVEKISKQQGYTIFASDLSESAVDIRSIDWSKLTPSRDDSNGDGEAMDNDSDDTAKVCIVMGNEERGISKEMRQLADQTFVLPMVGFAESFNLSVATSIVLAHLSASSSDMLLRGGNLSTHELQCLRLRGVWNSLSQKRMGQALLKQAKVELPPEFFGL